MRNLVPVLVHPQEEGGGGSLGCVWIFLFLAPLLLTALLRLFLALLAVARLLLRNNFTLSAT